MQPDKNSFGSLCMTTEENMNEIKAEDIQELLTYFSKNTYKPHDGDTVANRAMIQCIQLFKADYNMVVISNKSGELSAHYPSQLPIMEYEHNMNAPYTQQAVARKTDTIYEHLVDDYKLKELMHKARLARCRARFPMPVILYKGKYICRAGTLSGGPEIYGRSGYDYIFNPTEYESNQYDVSPSDWKLFSMVRSADINLLKALNVGTIADFMVEKKKVKFGMNVTSSEKVDKANRYNDFLLLSLPYPGCEFFKDYRENNYTGEALVFDWSQTFVDAGINVPEDNISGQLQINWADYKSWDLEIITKNYLKLLLKYLSDSSAGLLIHCISGWDRTPLFISLLRLSLWADGLIHQTLDPHQILYLTIAYDWMLFGHHLADRLGKGEEIFFFCFNILKKLTDDEYSVQGSSRFKPKADRGGDKTVNRNDSDGLLDGILFDNDRGSNISLSSTCSSVSTKSQEIPPMFWHAPTEEQHIMQPNYQNGNIEPCTSSAKSPHSKRTSPVTVPATAVRQRQESSSSVSLGSWQLINTAGSVRDSDASDSNITGVDISQITLTDEDIIQNNDRAERRKSRLLAVREIFLNAYHVSIGFKFGKSSGGILGNIAEKVGLGGARP